MHPVLRLEPPQPRTEAEPLVHASLGQLGRTAMQRPVACGDRRHEADPDDAIRPSGVTRDCLKLAFECLPPHRAAGRRDQERQPPLADGDLGSSGIYRSAGAHHEPVGVGHGDGCVVERHHRCRLSADPEDALRTR
jgi:hypothetical protein